MKNMNNTNTISTPSIQIPAMTPPMVLAYLKEIGQGWTGQGVAVEMGSWLGATAVALLEGLVEAGYNKPMYCFDKWMANGEQVKKAHNQGLEIALRQDLLPLFMDNVNWVYSNVKPLQGQIRHRVRHYPGDPVEICLFDAPKREPTFSVALKGIVKYFIPGVTVFGLMDYYFYLSRDRREYEFLAPVRLIKNNPGCFTRLQEWPGKSQSVFFRYEKPLIHI